MDLAIYNISGKKGTKKAKLSDDIFGIEPNDHAIYLDVKQHLANKRQGTHKAKERGEITGSTRKIKKQKGTGTARAGSIKNPIFRGGGRAFGPRPRNYGFKLNKKLKQLARRSALSYKAKDESVMIVEDFSLDTPKTKQYAEILGNLKVGDKKSVLVLAEPNKNIALSSRNLGNAKVLTVSELNTYEIMKAGSIMFLESSVKEVESILS